MQGIKRRIVYLSLYEGIAIVMSSVGLALIMGAAPAEAGFLSVAASVIALVWNLLYNMGFEAAEARFGIKGRGLAIRIVHALGFEAGLVAVLVPLIAWVLGVTLIEAFLLDLGLIVFFLFYTFAFNLGFDRVFGLPASAMAEA
ncbi:MAG: hypothetical protein DI556_02650 [Rhodovulum sulfidophilum]|uniref:Chlorhexidine efflux transporter domain-containing protein n=1 Tax=Rhodovulum sulfidophilum TaxID=35806 RepID=A0A2W5Q5C3_RHOSU|nr:MAG: hypothetical protein DI556_02650 [Rhodovulum sulfidophilum]